MQWRFYEFLCLRIEDLPKASAVVSDIRKILRQVGSCAACCSHEPEAAPARVVGRAHRCMGAGVQAVAFLSCSLRDPSAGLIQELHRHGLLDMALRRLAGM